MSDIFLSYKSENRARAQTIAEALESNGYSVWWDRVIPPGRPSDEVIEEELNNTKCVVVLWSKESVGSHWVKTEADEGFQRRILIPVLIDDVKVPLAFRRLKAAKLMDWNGKLPNYEFNLLIESVARIVGVPQEIKIEKSVEKKDEIKEVKEGKTISNSIGTKLALIPEGEFNMGSPTDEKGRYGYEGPVHKVKISKPFYLGMYPVTQKEWKAVMGDNTSYFKGEDLPVESVSWDNVQEFIKKLNKKEGIHKYRLPSEAEWEYAARAGTSTSFSFGDNESNLDEYAWYSNNSGGKTNPVGQKKPNSWGLYDMHGNVWEWVQDTWHSSYDGAPEDGSSWEKGGSARVVRGGCWRRIARYCRSANRVNDGPGYRDDGLGFRLLREL